MRIFLVFSIASALSHAALRPLDADLSPDTARRCREIETMLAKTQSGRLILAESSGVERREARQGIAFLYAHPALTLNPRQIAALGPWEAELAFSRELARAGMDLPLELHEGLMAAYQKELEFAVDLARANAVFGRALRRAFGRVEKRLQAAGLKALPDLPPEELERAAYFSWLFARDPEEFYWAVERHSRADPESFGLRELEDFVERHAERLESLPQAPDAPYVRLEGRRYRSRLAFAGREILRSGRLARIRESLGPFDSVGAAALKPKITSWLRDNPDPGAGK